jgi:hypothetical protein
MLKYLNQYLKIVLKELNAINFLNLVNNISILLNKYVRLCFFLYVPMILRYAAVSYVDAS